MSEQKSRIQIICDKINSSDHEGDVLAPLWVLEVALVLVVSQTRWLHEMVDKEIIGQAEFQVVKDLINRVGPQLEILAGGLDESAN